MASIPAYRTQTAVLNPGYRVASRTRTHSRVHPLGAAVAFLGLTYGFFSAGSLAASVMTEQARQEAIRAMSRTKLAVASEASLTHRVDELNSLGSVDRWAASQGFVAPGRGPVSSHQEEDVPRLP